MFDFARILLQLKYAFIIWPWVCCIQNFKKVLHIRELNFEILFPICIKKMLFLQFKGRVQCFSIQVKMNKCFLLNPENLTQIRLVVFEKKNAKTAQLRHTPIPKK